MAPIISVKKIDRGVAARDYGWRFAAHPNGVSVARFSGTVREVERGFQCFRHLANRGVLERIFNALSDDPNCENVFVDGTTAPRQTRTGH